MPDPIRWRCALDADSGENLQCAQDIDPDFIDVVLETWSGLPHTYRADFRESGSVGRLVRQKPQLYAGRTWTIPLLGPALDAGRLRELASAVLCGREPACSVDLRAPGLATANR